MIVTTDSRKPVGSGNNNRRVIADIKFFKAGKLSIDQADVDVIVAYDKFAEADKG